MEFPLFKTKIKGLRKKFNLNDPQERKKYFRAKAGKKIKKLKNFLKKQTFIAYLLGKKNSGKGTYSKMFAEIMAPIGIDHFSIGDMVRALDVEISDKKKKKELVDFLKANYRGWTPLEEAIYALEHRDTSVLLPTELILALVKREIAKREKRTIFIDGFPRDLDQASFCLFFKELIGYRDDPDVFILIDVPDVVIDERIKWRRICPLCQTSRNLKLLPTSKIGYRQTTKEFYLLCDNPLCQEIEMIPKEGDELGIEPIKERLIKDGTLLEKISCLYGVAKVFLRNSLPVAKAKELVDDYEITPEYQYFYDEKTKKVKIKEKPWIVKDNSGIPSYSLMPPPVVLSLIDRLVKIFKL